MVSREARLAFLSFDAAALLAGLVWALMPVLVPPQGCQPVGDLILDRCVICVVDPREIEASDLDLFFEWSLAEAKARGLIVAVAWSPVAAISMWRRKRGRDEEGPSQDSTVLK